MQVTDYYKAKKEKLHADFVSVKDLIQHYEATSNDGIDVIASALLTFFEELPLNDRPRYGFADDINMSFNELDRVREKSHLDDLLTITATGGGLGDVSDHFGWMRQELFVVFSARGFDVPPDLPPWSGVSSNASRREHLEIKGALYSSLVRAIRAFPNNFPDFNTRMPQAKEVKSWIKESGIETTDRPAQVLATMIIENFSTVSRK